MRKLFLTLSIVIVGLLLGLLPGQLVAQSPDTVWLRLTTQADSLNLRRTDHLPATFAPNEPGVPFAYALFDALRKGRLQAYADEAHTRAYTRRDIKAQLKPYRKWLKQRIRYNSDADNPASYYLAIDQREIWQPDSSRQVLARRIQLLPWDSTVSQPRLQWHFRTDDPAFNSVLDRLRIYRDYTADASIPPSGLLARHLVNDRVIGSTPRRVPLYRPKRQPGYSQDGTRSIRIRIPSMLDATNSSPTVRIRKEMAEASQVLVQQAGQQLMKAILTRRIPMYYLNVPRKLPRDQAARLIRQHRNAPGDAAKRKDARKLDFSFGVTDLQVSGTLFYDGGRIRFAAETVDLVWRDDSQAVAVSGLGLIRIADITKLDVRINGKLLAEALADIGSYHWYTVQLNDYAPQTVAACIDLTNRLVGGDWKRLPLHADHELQLSGKAPN